MQDDASADVSVDHRLAAYGTLRPGEANHYHLSALGGIWRPGTVRGHSSPGRQGSARGYPGLVPDPEAGPVSVMLLESPDLPAHWARLDAFEGEGYRRVRVAVALRAGGTVEAWLYALAP